MPGRLGVILCVLCCVLVGACAASKKDMKMLITIDRDANEDSACRLSVVVVYDKALLPELSTLTAKQWFSKRVQYVREHKMGVYEELWEFVPGQKLAPIVRKVATSKSDAILFALYHSPGEHRFRFDPTAEVRINLTRSVVNVTGPPSKEAKEDDSAIKPSLLDQVQEKAADVELPEKK